MEFPELELPWRVRHEAYLRGVAALLEVEILETTPTPEGISDRQVRERKRVIFAVTRWPLAVGDVFESPARDMARVQAHRVMRISPRGDVFELRAEADRNPEGKGSIEGCTTLIQVFSVYVVDEDEKTASLPNV